ncbi:COR domain-containing protein [Thiothrix unzii]|nr:COR domain-containing protein [Thiothrix unzii]
MSRLSTKEELKKLYNEKGHDALVWFAWRNILRALPKLGEYPLDAIWNENRIRNIYSICRVPLLLAQWQTDPGAVSNSASYASVIVGSSITCTASSSDSEISFFAGNIVMCAMEAARSTDTYYTINATYDALSYAGAVIGSGEGDADLIKLAQQDKAAWSALPLWESDSERVVKWKYRLLSNLREVGLEFLADDIANMWEGNPLGSHATNYLKSLSDTITNDAEQLRRAILFGETIENIHAVRVLLLGPGGAGKSSLADRLQSKPISQVKKLTVGIDYLNHQPLNLHENFPYLQQGEKPLDLYLWDFGGQTIFHGLHSAFLHENCVYALVVDSRHEQAPDEWLHQIRHLAGSQAKVLLVTNWYEACETRQNEARLLREFPDLLDNHSFFYFSCHEPEADEFRKFLEALEQASLASQRMVLKETLDVNEALQQRYQDDVFLESIDLDKIIEQVTQRTEAVATLPNKLEQLGFLVRVDSDDQRYCLKPAWAIDHAYAVLYSPTLREAKGVLQLKTLQRDFKDKINPQHIAYLVEFLQTRSLCRKLPNGSGYFFPDAASADELPEASELLANASSLVIRFELPYLPLGFHAALVYRLFTPDGITTPDDIWRQGFILRKNTSRAVVHYLSRKSIIEMALTGEWQDFSALLNALLVNMKAVLTEGKGGIREEQIHPSVVLDRHVFSVHSGERLVDVLGQINSYDQLFREVRALASKNIIINNAPNQGNQAGEQIFNDQSSVSIPDVKTAGNPEKWYDKHWWAVSLIPASIVMIITGILAWLWTNDRILGTSIGAVLGVIVYVLMFLNNPKRRFFRAAWFAFFGFLVSASPWITGKFGYSANTSESKTGFELEWGIPMDAVLSALLLVLAGFLFHLDSKQK